MSTMKLILTQEVTGLGTSGDTVGSGGTAANTCPAGCHRGHPGCAEQVERP